MKHPPKKEQSSEHTEKKEGSFGSKQILPQPPKSPPEGPKKKIVHQARQILRWMKDHPLETATGIAAATGAVASLPLSLPAEGGVLLAIRPLSRLARPASRLLVTAVRQAKTAADWVKVNRHVLARTAPILGRCLGWSQAERQRFALGFPHAAIGAQHLAQGRAKEALGAFLSAWARAQGLPGRSVSSLLRRYLAKTRVETSAREPVRTRAVGRKRSPSQQKS